MTTVDVSPAISTLLIPMPYRVVDKIAEAPGVFSLHVVPVEGELPTFTPAQCSMLGAFGVGEAAISISSATANTEYHAYTIRGAGPISNALIETPIGDLITVRGPFGEPWPLPEVDTGQLLIVAGGLGIAPLRSAIHEAVARKPRFDRLAVVYGAKTPDDLIYPDDLAYLENAGAEVALTVDVADDSWTGPVGVVPDLLGVDAGVDMDWADTTAFVCGPEVMMHFTATALLRLGMPIDRIWFTLERNMQCGNALCGHCQLGPLITCRDGPVANYADIAPFYQVKEL
jgi:anaerobic sulfite reductase subunit B